MDENEVIEAIKNQVILRDGHDDQQGRPVGFEWDENRETLLVKIVDGRFSRWSDSMDLEPV